MAKQTRTSHNEESPVDKSANTSWKVTIYSTAGEKIVQGQSFLKIVPEPQKLIGNLRKGARLPALEPVVYVDEY